MLHEAEVGDKIDSPYCGKTLVDPKIALLCPGHTASSGLVKKKGCQKDCFLQNPESTINTSSKTTAAYQMLILCQTVD